jgi:NADH-quinone oxidoreductase subunit N
MMNVAAFGVLILLPSRGRQPATSAETFEDLAGQGRRHVALGLAMAVACFSLIGMPLTIGFFGKFLLLKPAFEGHQNKLVVITVINAAISAAYYLKIVASLFLRPEPAFEGAELPPPRINLWRQEGVVAAVILSTAATIAFGAVFPASQQLSDWATSAAQINPPAPAASAPPAPMMGP